jgi:integrase/recombinase XerD
MPTTLLPSDTIDTPEMWKSSPALAFIHFVRTSDFLKMGRRPPSINTHTGQSEPNKIYPIRDSSVNVLVSMFGKYLRWLESRHMTVFEVQSIHILTFLDVRDDQGADSPKQLNSRIRTKYLRLLEKVYRRLNATPNPASNASVTTNQTPGGKGRDLPPEFLTQEEVTAFMEALPEATNWKRCRDRALLAVLLGAGLKPSEVIGLRTENIGHKNGSGSIPVTISAASVGGTSRWHQSQLRPLAVSDVENWLIVREKLNVSGDILFPSNTAGDKIDKSTLYRNAKKTFSRAGIDVTRWGGRTLRNTFALTELRQGTTPEAVGEFLGLCEAKSMQSYLALV